MAWVALGWAWFGSSATVLLNTYIDRDANTSSHLNFVPSRRPRVPESWLLVAALASYAVGLGILAWAAPRVAPLFFAMMLLSVAYSAPPIRLKARAGFDLVVNAVGYGGATFLAGWASIAPLDGVAFGVAIVPTLLIAAGHPLTTLFQAQQDGRKGWRTLPVALGHFRSVLLAAFLFALHVASLVVIIHAGPLPRPLLASLTGLPFSLVFLGFWTKNPQWDSREIAYLGWLGANALTLFYFLTTLLETI